jgi:hypothetical protein
VVLSPYKRPGYRAEDYQVLHIDCRASSVVLLRSDGRGKIQEVGRTGTTKLDDNRSDYQRLIMDHRQLDHALVLFWVRPDGAATLESAIKKLPDGTPYGFEPADADWSFQTTGR